MGASAWPGRREGVGAPARGAAPGLAGGTAGALWRPAQLLQACLKVEAGQGRAGRADRAAGSSALTTTTTTATRPPQALLLLGREPSGTPSPGTVKEYYSEEAGRLYYCIDDAAPPYNSWRAPPRFAYAEWALDAGLYRLPLPLARDLYRALEDLLAGEGAAPPPPVAQRAVEVLAALVGNVADCSNADPK